MKKLLFLLFLCALQAMAQNHSVVSSLTVVDSASCANNATTSGSTLLLSPLAGNDASVVIQLSGTFSATAQFQGTGDGANWVSVNALPVSGTQTAVTSATAAGAWRVTASGLQAVRVCLSVYASGAVQTSITSSAGPSANGLGGGGGGGSGTVTSVTIAGTANQVTASGTCTITTSGTCTLSQPNAVILGTDNSAAGTLQLANSAAAAHTIWASGATTSNTVAGPATVPASGDLLSCTTASTTCTLTDSGVVASKVPVGCNSGCSYVLTQDDIAVAAAPSNIKDSTANDPILVKFYNNSTRALGNVCVEVTAVSSGGHMDVGVYSISGTTLTLIWHTGSLSTTATGAQCFTPTASSMAGATSYYAGLCGDNNTSTLAGLGTGGPTGLLGSSGPAHTWGINATDTCTAGVLPGTATTTNITNSSTSGVAYLYISN